MNLNNLKASLKSYLKIHLLFFSLVLAIEVLILSYWQLVLAPRIKAESDASAQIIAESQGRLISQSLISAQGNLQLEDVHELLDTTEILKDPVLGQVFFTGIMVELDPASVAAQDIDASMEQLTIQRGDTLCQTCFRIEVALYSINSNELIGLATFYVNDAIFHQYISDMKAKIYAEAVMVLFIAILIWLGVISLFKQLQREIVERKKAEHKAESASQAKSQFLANMSHELRTPLNAVIGMSYLMSRDELSDKQRQRLQKMDSSAQLLLSLINDILDFSKNEAGMLQLEKIPFTLSEIFENLQKLNSSILEEKQLALNFVVADDVPQELLGDPMRLGQILLNLLTNAIKFTHQGHIEVKVQSQARYEESVTLLFSVQDTGIGIDEDKKGQLFQSFSQLEDSTTRLYGGTGLGLVICKQLTELMHGEIWVESEKNCGSQFYFSVDLGLTSGQHLKGKSVAHINQIPQWPGIKILLVEDVVVNQEVIVTILEETQMFIDVANHGLEALECVQGSNYDLILMDIQMPEMNGYQATQKIRDWFDEKQLPIVAMTAYSLAEDRQKCIKVGMNDFIAKPIVVKKLFQILQKWLPAPSDFIAVAPIGQDKEWQKIQKILSGVDVKDAMTRCKNEPKQLYKLLSDWVNLYQKQMPELRQLIISQAWENADKIVHAMKGSSGNLCLIDIYEMAVGLKITLNQQELDKSMSLFLRMEQGVVSLAGDLNQLHHQIDRKESEPQNTRLIEAKIYDPIKVDQLIQQLKPLIKGNNLQAEQVFERLDESLTPDIFKAHLDRLRDELSDFDFDQAWLTINKIEQQNRLSSAE